ncbi:uncharacterized mitochondrial protein AtMg00810-like [Vicia villosa]|uniref:uncharacterized mitochondrial protein AtMg00810-like n=1 Tax=Vicia villosa TaxID=3911 RepID=UPI00273C1CD9|nr:uncharacterized mitochondrial protein AtMg00810-like [Vicia villosa]
MILIISLYEDDLIYTGNNKKMFEGFKESMKKMFAMTDMGMIRYFIGVEMKQESNGIFIGQQKYANEVLTRFGIDESNKVCNPIVLGYRLTKDESGKLVDATNYKQMVGNLMCLLATRYDISYSVCLVARYMERPIEAHLEATKRILRYFKGTVNLGILYKINEEAMLQGWLDSGYARDNDDKK